MADTVLAISQAVLGSSVLLIAVTSVYVLTTALLPVREGYQVTQQLAVAVGLTIVSLGFITMALSYTRWKISFWPLVVSLVLLSAASLALEAYLRRSAPEQPTPRGGEARSWRSVANAWRNRASNGPGFRGCSLSLPRLSLWSSCRSWRATSKRPFPSSISI